MFAKPSLSGFESVLDSGFSAIVLAQGTRAELLALVPRNFGFSHLRYAYKTEVEIDLFFKSGHSPTPLPNRPSWERTSAEAAFTVLAQPGGSVLGVIERHRELPILWVPARFVRSEQPLEEKGAAEHVVTLRFAR